MKHFSEKIFQSYLMGGFECSTHRNFTKNRLDLIEWTRHDEFATEDYARLISQGMLTARDGVRWHLIEQTPRVYDFSSLANQARAAQELGLEVIWDLFHYGYPDDLDIFSAEFVERFAEFALATVKFLQTVTERPLFICPINEISFFAWIAGDVGGFYPFKHGSGNALKRQLVKATIESMRRIRDFAPATRFVQTDPAIRVVPSNPKDARNVIDALRYHQSQFEAFDMLCGKTAPELGGAPEFLDIIGINYYYNNQWRHPSGRRIYRHNKSYQPFSAILQSFYERYERPMFVAETGIENKERPSWFRYIFDECEKARTAGVDLHGICLYPIVNHQGWDDKRHCHNGLWDYPNKAGEREIYQPLADEIEIVQKQMSLKMQKTAFK